jgi:hypothetical protein
MRLLQPLSPDPNPEATLEFTTRLVDKAIALRTLMSEEQAIYRCYFVESGNRVDPQWIELAYGDKPNSTVIMCTYPGLRRFSMHDGKREFIPIVKATAMLKVM